LWSVSRAAIAGVLPFKAWYLTGLLLDIGCVTDENPIEKIMRSAYNIQMRIKVYTDKENRRILKRAEETIQETNLLLRTLGMPVNRPPKAQLSRSKWKRLKSGDVSHNC
jgi:hypothetical protein